jgi:hypothetical protein
LHVPPSQTYPAEQRSPPQHFWPLPPQAEQVLAAVQTLSTPQMSPMGRQTGLGPPEARPLRQQPVLHFLPLVQQVCISPPQPAHLPVGRQRSPAEQVLPVAMQILLLVSQQPLLQVSLAQQGWPGPPQTLHCPAEQIVPDALQTLPGQHGCPALPQAWQAPAQQASLEPMHLLYWQQDCPA